LKELYELGIVFRGFILVQNIFKSLPDGKKTDPDKDLRGAFISAISSFAETAFTNVYLEYLESGNILFIFKMAEVQSLDSNIPEPVILYGLTEKRKNVDKFVKKFLEKVSPIIQLFVHKYNKKDFTELNQFESFRIDMKSFFV